MGRIQPEGVHDIYHERLGEPRQALDVERSGERLTQTGARPVQDDAVKPIEASGQRGPARAAGVRAVHEHDRWALTNLLDPDRDVVALKVEPSFGGRDPQGLP